MNDDPLSLYRARLAQGCLRADPVQELAAEKLNSLHHALKGYQPSSGRSGWRARFGFARMSPDMDPPQGLYLYGPVGRGKSMLMDVFVHTAPVKACRRVHFHEFLRDFHKAVHAWRKSPDREGTDPVPPLARRMAQESWLLCLDELEVRDIADAMIIGRIFEELFRAGAVIVVTSNRAPDELYKDGLQREKFLPFISMIKTRLDLLELTSPTDYRLGRMKGAQIYHTPLGSHADRALDDAFFRLAGGLAAVPVQLDINGRALSVPLAAGDVARFSFRDLCEHPLAATDYLHLASAYDAVVLDSVPVLGPHNRDHARRFVMLIDALYDHKTLLVLSAEADPEHLYPDGDGAFEFQRTVSRLMEMQSEGYIGARHVA
ncbi:cell division protein ZapE [Haematospirillum sp. H1815]|uniref:cell division protein ZapE n=1 Tax=Haematospirillum sp. H1815 TaxID=2723108 RepID=UPI00143BA966|nr:cell division protein ZapE [Haematospirillum sp. H1815]NKD77369.1 cell division protein ZapE [Haematospirillum sp. H1815]